MSLDQMLSEAADLAETFLKGKLKVNAMEVGLDFRAGTLYVGGDFIATHDWNRYNLDYFGGFEYVEKDLINVVGDYVFYSSQSDRVQEAIDYAESKGHDVWDSPRIFELREVGA